MRILNFMSLTHLDPSAILNELETRIVELQRQSLKILISAPRAQPHRAMSPPVSHRGVYYISQGMGYIHNHSKLSIGYHRNYLAKSSKKASPFQPQTHSTPTKPPAPTKRNSQSAVPYPAACSSTHIHKETKTGRKAMSRPDQ